MAPQVCGALPKQQSHQSSPKKFRPTWAEEDSTKMWDWHSSEESDLERTEKMSPEGNIMTECIMRSWKRQAICESW